MRISCRVTTSSSVICQASRPDQLYDTRMGLQFAHLYAIQQFTQHASVIRTLSDSSHDLGYLVFSHRFEDRLEHIRRVISVGKTAD